MAWLQLVFETDAAGAPALSDLLAEAGAAAVTLQDAADQPLYEPPLNTTPLWQATRVIGLFEAQTDPHAVIRALESALAPAPLPPWRLEALEEREWSRVWMDGFKPLRCGERLWVVPSWCEVPEPQAVNILLDPGLAFGTGTHPTTRLCLAWLDAHVRPDDRVIDYGCGSGILAIGAALLGATHVDAVDNDPQALLATRENAERNGVAERIVTLAPDAPAPAPADRLVANILAGPLIELAPRLTALVRPGGEMALSGILPEQAEAVAAAYADDFELEPATIEEGWVRIAGVRRG